MDALALSARMTGRLSGTGGERRGCWNRVYQVSAELGSTYLPVGIDQTKYSRTRASLARLLTVRTNGAALLIGGHEQP